MSVIIAVRRPRQEECNEFKVILSHIVNTKSSRNIERHRLPSQTIRNIELWLRGDCSCH